MFHRLCALLAAFALLFAGAQVAHADLLGSLKPGDVELKSAGALAFGPEGILFIGDAAMATVYAVDTGDRTAPTGEAAKATPTIEGINDKIGALLGIEGKNVQIKDIAVNPITGATFLSVSRGKAAGSPAVIIRAARDGKLTEQSLKGVKSSRATFSGIPTSPKQQQEVITHLAFLKDKVIVAGLSNEKFASRLRSVPFPFDKTDGGASIEIYHGAHGALETRSPVRVFAHYQIKGEDHLLAAYTCTPLVKFPVADLKPGMHVKGVTVAELGNRNRPLSMIVYNKGGKDYVLMANNSRGLMKIDLAGIESMKGITSKISGTAGLKYDKVEGMDGVMKLDAFGKEHAVVLVDTKGTLDLKTIALP